MAGGIDLINEMKLGSEVDHVVYLADIPMLHGIKQRGEYLVVGAATTHAEIERDPKVNAVLRQLPAIIQEIGNVRVRLVGTIGGNVMAANRYYDWLPLLMAFDAELCFDDRGKRWYPAHTLTSSRGEWKIPHCLLTTIRIPLGGSPRIRFNRDLKPAISIAVCVRNSGHGEIGRVAVGCMWPAPIVAKLEGFDEIRNVALDVRSRVAEFVQDPRPRVDAVAEAIGARAAAMLPKPQEDGLVSSDYRRAMARTLISRTLHEVLDSR